jgi:pyrroline-5-carboxylate reductase
MKRLAIIGVGKMGAEILKTLHPTPYNISAVEANQKTVKKLQSKWEIHQNVDGLRGEFHSLIMAVKPNEAMKVSHEIHNSERKSQIKVPCVVSCMAGVSSSTLRTIFPKKKIVRIMPNMGIGSGKGLTSVYGPEPHARRVRDMFNFGGIVHAAKSDDEIDAVTCIASSGPAYFLKLAEIMAKEGVDMGLSEPEATMLARSALLSATLSPCGIESIASPGGTTERALKTLEDYKFSDAIRAAIRQSWCRAKNIDSDVRYQFTKEI